MARTRAARRRATCANRRARSASPPAPSRAQSAAATAAAKQAAYDSTYESTGCAKSAGAAADKAKPLAEVAADAAVALALSLPSAAQVYECPEDPEVRAKLEAWQDLKLVRQVLRG